MRLLFGLIIVLVLVGFVMAITLPWQITAVYIGVACGLPLVTAISLLATGKVTKEGLTELWKTFFPAYPEDDD